METDLMPHRPDSGNPATPSIEVSPNLLSAGDHVWVGRDGEQEWKRVERVEYRPDGWKHNALGQATAAPKPHHVVFCSDGWEAVVMAGDEIEVRIGATGQRGSDKTEA